MTMLTIGTLARRAGVKPSAIRYYEAQGLLRPGRLPNGYRFYDGNAVAALRFVRSAQRFGLTLGEVRQLLEIWRSGSQPCGHLRDLAHYHLSEIDNKLRELRSLRKQFRVLLEGKTPYQGAAAVCPMIECADGPSADSAGILGLANRRSSQRPGPNGAGRTRMPSPATGRA